MKFNIFIISFLLLFAGCDKQVTNHYHDTDFFYQQSELYYSNLDKFYGYIDASYTNDFVNDGAAKEDLRMAKLYLIQVDAEYTSMCLVYPEHTNKNK